MRFILIIQRAVSAVCICAHCAPTKAQALEESRPVGLGFARWVGQFFAPLAKSSPDYAYMAEVVKHLGSGTWEELVDGLPYFLVGAPEESRVVFRKFSSSESPFNRKQRLSGGDCNASNIKDTLSLVLSLALDLEDTSSVF